MLQKNWNVYGLLKQSKTHVAKLNALNPESVFGLTFRSDWHPEVSHQRDVTSVKRSGERLNMESKNQFATAPREACYDQE